MTYKAVVVVKNGCELEIGRGVWGDIKERAFGHLVRTKVSLSGRRDLAELYKMYKELLHQE
jgi:hypothetical protein